jgi:hypothetical protein
VTYVLVLRDTEKKVSRVWHGARGYSVIYRALQAIRRQQIRWPNSTDDFILAHYKVDMSAEVIAQHLSKRLGRTVTKNAVIGRVTRLKRHAHEQLG